MNKHIVDAAPDLLEACQNASSWIADHFEDFDDETNKELLCLSNELERAITKATK